MREDVEQLFREQGIVCAEAMAFAQVGVVNERILERLDFTPVGVLVFAVPYYTGEAVNLSKYAVSEDYHRILGELSRRVTEGMARLFPGAHMAGYADHSPIDERYAASRCGLGIIGDNGLLIHPEYGSYVFLGDILTDIDPDLLGAPELKPISFCEHCGACRRACPTGILRGEGKDCLSMITQRKGLLSYREKMMMRTYHTVWGCDVCQDVCPHNKNPKKTPIELFWQRRIVHLTRAVLDGMGEDEFRARAYAWRGRKTVERNLAVYEEPLCAEDESERDGSVSAEKNGK